MGTAPGLVVLPSGRVFAAGGLAAGVDPAVAGFRALALQVRAMGLLDRRPGYYRVKITLTIAAFFAGWALFVFVGDSWAALAVAPLVGVMFTQLGFLGHDAGHNQVFGARRRNRLLGLIVANALIGLSFGWWVPKHSAHHAHPNQVGRDPDIGEGVVLASSGPLGSWLARWQAPLFFPLMLLRSAGLHVLGIRRLARRRDRAAAVDACLIVVHAGLYLGVVLWVLSPVKALAFVVVQQAVFSLYLGISFAPNHKGMPVIGSATAAGFARRQVVTARNVRGGRLTAFMLGGLNYQIEHHLFETMPRPNLRRVQGLVRDFCVATDLGYCEESFLGSFRQIIQHLSDAGAAANPETRHEMEADSDGHEALSSGAASVSSSGLARYITALPWTDTWRRRLQRLDHAMIFFLISCLRLRRRSLPVRRDSAVHGLQPSAGRRHYGAFSQGCPPGRNRTQGGIRRSVGAGTGELAAGSGPRLAAEAGRRRYVRRGSGYSGMRRPDRRAALLPSAAAQTPVGLISPPP
jgi:fatty acid desaturase